MKKTVIPIVASVGQRKKKSLSQVIDARPSNSPLSKSNYKVHNYVHD